MTAKRRGLPPGIRKLHSRRCPAYRDREARYRCKAGYQVQAGPRSARQTRTFATLDAAKSWKADQDKARVKTRLAAERPRTLRQAYVRWKADAEAGVALARGGKRFKPGTLHDYCRNMEVDLLDDYAPVSLGRLGDRLDEVVGGLQRRGLAASTVRK